MKPLVAYSETTRGFIYKFMLSYDRSFVAKFFNKCYKTGCHF